MQFPEESHRRAPSLMRPRAIRLQSETNILQHGVDDARRERIAPLTHRAHQTRHRRHVIEPSAVYLDDALDDVAFVFGPVELSELPHDAGQGVVG